MKANIALILNFITIVVCSPSNPNPCEVIAETHPYRPTVPVHCSHQHDTLTNRVYNSGVKLYQKKSARLAGCLERLRMIKGAQPPMSTDSVGKPLQVKTTKQPAKLIDYLRELYLDRLEYVKSSRAESFKKFEGVVRNAAKKTIKDPRYSVIIKDERARDKLFSRYSDKIKELKNEILSKESDRTRIRSDFIYHLSIVLKRHIHKLHHSVGREENHTLKPPGESGSAAGLSLDPLTKAEVGEYVKQKLERVENIDKLLKGGTKFLTSFNTFTTACYTGVARTLNAYLLTKMMGIFDF